MGMNDENTHDERESMFSSRSIRVKLGSTSRWTSANCFTDWSFALGFHYTRRSGGLRPVQRGSPLLFDRKLNNDSRLHLQNSFARYRVGHTQPRSQVFERVTEGVKHGDHLRSRSG